MDNCDQPDTDLAPVIANARSEAIIKARIEKVESQNPKVLAYLSRRVELGVDEPMCNYYISRKKRSCTHRAAAGSDRCTDHSEEALKESRLRDAANRARAEDLKKLKEQQKQQQESGEKEDDEADKAASAEQRKKQRVSAPKRMANPFSLDLTPDISSDIANWDKFFTSLGLNAPLHIDVGCAKGRCIQRMSKKVPRKHWNHLGVEIRKSLVDYALDLEAQSSSICNCGNSGKGVDERVEEEVTTTATTTTTRNGNTAGGNLHFMTCNFAVSAETLLRSLPPACLRLVSIQFPDPWRKSKHEKRLIVQKALVQTLARYMTAGACVYISSDCEDVALKMNECFLNATTTSTTTDADASSSSSAAASSSPNNNSVITTNLRYFDVLPACRIVHSRASSSASSFPVSSHSIFDMVTAGSFLKGASEAGVQQQQAVVMSPTVISPGKHSLLGRTTTANSPPHSDRNNGCAPLDPTLLSMSGSDERWLKFNPLDEPSERELVCEIDWRRVWRRVYVRNNVPPPVEAPTTIEANTTATIASAAVN